MRGLACWMERSDGSRGAADLDAVLAGFLPGEYMVDLAALLGVVGFFACLSGLALDGSAAACSSRASPFAGLRRRRRRRLAVPSPVAVADDATEALA